MSLAFTNFWFGDPGKNEFFNLEAVFFSTEPSVVEARDGDDYVVGTIFGDLIRGGTGSDLVVANAGDDLVFGDDLSDPSSIGAKDMLFARSGADTVFAGEGDDFASGDDGNDFVDGGKGNDTLWGGTEADVIFGGDGNDELWGGTSPASPASFTFNTTISFDGTTSPSSAIAPFDLVAATVFTTFAILAANDPSNDQLFGGSGDDVLHGQLGNDALYGGRGFDGFYFDTALNPSTNVDTIVGFSHRDDTILLSKAIFTELGLGVLKNKNFHIGNKAADGNDLIIYNERNGRIFYDHDGQGGDAKVLFAVLDRPVDDLTRQDFFIVASAAGRFFRSGGGKVVRPHPA